MKQILHIFVKDVRHQWLEILISLTATAVLAFTYHSVWRTGLRLYRSADSFSPFGLVNVLPELLVLIVPLRWWLLISPVVHEENLVGDRQFWITRPYEWKKLLAAKMLFLVVCLYIPLLVAQCVILARAGFSPFPSFPGLLYDSLLLTGVLVFPLVVLATVTRNFARMTLAILGAAVSMIAVAWVASNAPPDRVGIPHGNEIGLSLALCLCVTVVVLQYAKRNVKASWTLLAFLVALFGVFALGGAPGDARMNRTYARQQPALSAAQFAYPEKEGNEPSAFVTRKSDRVGISFPILVSGVADGTVTIPDFLKVTLEAPGGARWVSVWQSIYMEKFFPGENVANASFTMPRAIYNDFKGKPLNVQVPRRMPGKRSSLFSAEMILPYRESVFARRSRSLRSDRTRSEVSLAVLPCGSPNLPLSVRPGPLVRAADPGRMQTIACKLQPGSDRSKERRWILVSLLCRCRP
jgi:hypothetical protein